MSLIAHKLIIYGKRLCSYIDIYAHSTSAIYVCSRSKSDTMRYLNVAEKNDAAKNIAMHLSRGTSKRREGLSKFNKIYEFEAEVLGQKSQMIMTSVSGHLLALEFVGSYKSWQSCSPLSLFDAQVFKYCPKNYEKIKETLEREIRHCQGLIIWTDCDREGENIGFEIISVCTAVKSNLGIYRAKFSEITFASVQRALRNLEQPNKNVSDAVDVRQELDLRIGAAFTRLQTLRLTKVFPSQLAEKLVSYGSCQFPTLGFVVERYRAIENFVAESFWKIAVNHTIDNLSVNFIWERGRLFDQHACQVLLSKVLEQPEARVVKVSTQPKSKWRPLPLDTVELEKLASRKLKINAKETMRLAEKLYTQGFISYPRTETNQFPKEMNLRNLVQLHTGDANWGAFAQRVLDDGGPTPRQGNKTDMAHPPIHPTKHTNSLSGNEFRLYEFIVRSFLACCSKDAQGQETTAAVVVAGETFSASGLLVTARNYLDVYPYDKWASKQIHRYEEIMDQFALKVFARIQQMNTIGPFTPQAWRLMGQVFTPTKIEMVDGTTSAPNLLTEADLIALMEKHGIGTDATHAEHIETIKSREYVDLTDGVHFVPTFLGMGLVEGYDAMGLHMSKPHLRAQLEADLKAVSEVRKLPQDVLLDQVQRYREAFIIVMEQANKMDSALALRFNERPSAYTPSAGGLPQNMPAAFKCPKCNADMVVRTRKNNDELYIGCMSYPTCRNAVWFPSVVKKVEILPETCRTCGPNYHKMKFEWRNNSISHLYPPPYIACIGGCDVTLLEHLTINLSSVKKVAPPTTTVNSSTTQSVNNSSRTNSVSSSTRTDRGSNNPQFDVTWNMNRSTNSTSTNAPPRLTPPPASTFLTARNVVPTNVSTGQRPRFTPPAVVSNTTRNSWTTDISNAGQRTPPNVPGAQSSVNSTRMPAPRRALPAPGDGQGGGNDIMCQCNKPAVLLTVRKQNQNQGRQFYKCQVGKDNGGCDFFSWATPPGEAPQRDGESSSNHNSSWGVSADSTGGGGNQHGWGVPRNDFDQNDDGKVCNCGIPCKQLTVGKDGPNKGRPFFACSKEFSSRCNFFEWADGGTSNFNWSSTESEGGRGAGYRSRGRGRGAGRGAGRAARGTGGARGGPRLCSLCRQEGHTRNRCPQASLTP